MFWRLGFQSTSTLDALLQRENPPTVEELLDEQDLLSEIKTGNNKLIQLLSTRDAVQSLFNWTTYGAEQIDRAEKERWRRAEEVYEQRQAGKSGSEANVQASNTAEGAAAARTPGSADTSPSVKQEWRRSVGFDATTSSGAADDEPRGTPSSAAPGDRADADANDKDEQRRIRYSQIATEILNSDIQSIVQMTMDNFEQYMSGLFDAVLPLLERNMAGGLQGEEAARSILRIDEPAMRRQGAIQQVREEMWDEGEEKDERRRETIRSNWARICGVYMGWRSVEMVKFLQTMPDIVARMVDRIESPAVQDFLLRIIACEEGGVAGTVKWLSSQHLIPRLAVLLSPYQPPSLHNAVSEVLRHIIALSSLSPFNPNGGNAAAGQPVVSPTNADGTPANGQQSPTGAEGAPTPGQQTPPPAGQRDNRLVRELVRRDVVYALVGFVLDHIDYTDAPPDESDKAGENARHSPSDPYYTAPLPSIKSATSSLCSSINVLIEIIRKNNSDFSEPHLFHTMRSHLIALQQSHAAQEAGKSSDVSKPAAVDLSGDGAAPEEATHSPDDAERERLEAAMAELGDKMGIVHLGVLLEAFSDRIEALQKLLQEPRSLAQCQTPGCDTPLTLERLRIVELYAELLHCSNMSILNRKADVGPAYSADGCLEGGLAALEQLGRVIEGDGADETSGEDVADEPEAAVGEIDKEAAHDKAVADATFAATSTPLPETPAVPPPPSDTDAARLKDVMLADPRLRRLANEARPPSEAASDSVAAIASASIMSEDGVDRRIPAEQQAGALGDRLKDRYAVAGVMQAVMSLFFDFPLNNFLHNVIYDLVQQTLGGKSSPGNNRRLILELFEKVRLVERILDTQRVQERLRSAGSKAGAARMALMGHVTLITDEIVKFLENCPAPLLPAIEQTYVKSEWEAYRDGPFRATKERDMQPLAGGSAAPAVQSSAVADGLDSDSDDEEGTLAKTLAGPPLARSVSHSADGYDAGSDNQHFSRYLLRETHPSALSSDDDSDDSTGSPQVSPATRAAAHAAFEGFDDFDDDEAWGNFATAPSNDAGADEDPFGDEFAPSTSAGHAASGSGSSGTWNARPPVTSAGFAEEAFKNWTSQADSSDDAIQMPDIGNDSIEDAEFAVKGWSIRGGEDVGERMPPATSSPLTSPPLSQSPSKRLTLENLPRSPVLHRARSRTSSTSSSHSAHQAMAMAIAASARGEAISPPDPSLMTAINEDEPLGHGVSADVTVREDGLLARKINGQTVLAPQDEIAAAAMHVRRNSQGG